ncbi:MAG: caspase family protein [Bacteroidota bacterium]
MKNYLVFFFMTAFAWQVHAQGCTQGNCINGVGTYVYSDGTKYVGEFKDEKSHGHGVCYFASGKIYIGEFADHQVAGYGTWVYPDSTKIIGHYDQNGNFVDHKNLTPGCLSGDCENGFGTRLWDGGTVYVGQFKDSKLDGLGTCYFHDGSKYTGEWSNSLHNGFGTYYYNDGSIGKGNWKDHIFLGSSDTKKCVSGDCVNGFGIYRYDDGGVYTGEFKDGKRHGQGTYYWAEGDKYVGNWINGNYEGQGTYTYNDGRVESGIWRDATLISKSTSNQLKPEITWEEPSTSTMSVTYATFQIKACIKSETDVKKVEVMVNGASIATETSFKKDPLSGCAVFFEKSFSLRSGKNSIVLLAHNEGGVTQSSERIVNLVTANQQKRLALVIGNSDYQHGNVLKNPINDARSMARILEGQGFKVTKIENATMRDLKMSIDNFGRELENYDVGLFYYAGHGIQVKGLNYLVPVDANIQSEAQVEYDCVQADRVLSFMEVAQTDVNIIILDACRNNPFKRSWSRSADTEGLAFMNAPTGTLIAYSTAPGRTASDGQGENGLYTEALLQEINNPDLTILQVFQRVRNRVSEKSSRLQIPWESTSLTGDFYVGKRN